MLVLCLVLDKSVYCIVLFDVVVGYFSLWCVGLIALSCLSWLVLLYWMHCNASHSDTKSLLNRFRYHFQTIFVFCFFGSDTDSDFFFFEHTLPTVKPVNNNISNTTTTTIRRRRIQLTLLIIICVFRMLWLSKSHERNMNIQVDDSVCFIWLAVCIITLKSLFFHNLITSARETIATFGAREITELGNRHM